MKKRSIQQLQLNKKTISTFKQDKVKGGGTTTDAVVAGVVLATWLISEVICQEH